MTPVPSGFLGHVRSFVAVQTGCDHRCTFCSIWQARGASRSYPFEAVREAVARELDRGAKEIVLTGVDITDYQDGLGRLCQRLLAAEPRLKRLRLSSLDSIEIDEALFELIAGEPRLMPHFHLSLQAGDDMILKRMKRRHSRADAVRTVERIKAARPDATIGADLIAGFPTETEANGAKQLETARRLRRGRRPHLPLLAAAEHARCAHAAIAARPGQGPRRPPARSRCRAPDALARQPDRDDPAGADRKRRPRATATGSHRCSSKARGAARPGVRGSPAAPPIIWWARSNELARPPARRICEDRGKGRRQFDRPDQPRRARHLDARRHRGGADRFGPGPEASHRIREAIARQKFERLDERGLRTILAEEIENDPRSGRQAAGNLGLSPAARDPGDRRQRLGQDHHHRQARPLAERAGLRRAVRRRRHLPRRRDRAAPDLGRPHRRTGHFGQGRRRRRRDRVRRREAGDRDRRGRADRRHRRAASE